jgi:hypothetical protein
MRCLDSDNCCANDGDDEHEYKIEERVCGPERQGANTVRVLDCSHLSGLLVGRIEGEEGGVDGLCQAKILVYVS